MEMGIRGQILTPGVWSPETLSGDWPKHWQGTQALPSGSLAWRGTCWMTEVRLSQGTAWGAGARGGESHTAAPIPQAWLLSANT